MNRGRVAALRDHLAATPPGLFDMRVLGDPRRGVPGCIAGHAGALWGWGLGAGSALGLTAGQARLLFHPGWAGGEACDATPAEAARVLDLLLETGEVRWDLAMAKRAEATDKGHA